jgi:phenylalanyl-tRNA synthetase beta subunit
LLLEISPSVKLRKEIDLYPKVFVPKIIELKYENLNKILGVVIDKEDVINILFRLGFYVATYQLD